MPSLIPGFEYDIFVSYRQKDNKYDGWVTEFVKNLKGEIESTFKEEIGIYFDINPHDGLLETHDVGASLKDKLKCLVFIPILSRTYCDPKSFAWEHEFKTFVEQASKDKFGLKVKLTNGNVANRVLPVYIHDLDNDDIKLCESLLGGVLRGVDFIYKEPGVNRSLLPKDNEDKNLSNTNYRNQINKVALAIKEIVLGLNADPSLLLAKPETPGEPDGQVVREGILTEQEKHVKLRNIKPISGVAILTVLIIAALIAYPKIFKRDTLKQLQSTGERISVAVMPFQNMTNDTIWNVWQDGIQSNIITSLSNYHEELIVRQIESVTSLIQNKGFTNYASITPSVASKISQKLDANVFIYGNIQQAGNLIRVNAQLIDSKTEEVIKSFQIEGPAREEMIFHIIDSLSYMVKNFLIISKLGKELAPDFQHFASTNSPEAYRYFIYGKKAFLETDYPTALNFLSKAVAIDSNFTMAIMQIAFAYGNQGMYKDAKKWSLKLYAKKDQMPLMQSLLANYTYSVYFESPYEAIKWLKRGLAFDDQSQAIEWSLGDLYRELGQYDKSIPEFEKALEITNKWGSKPMWVYSYTALGVAYHMTKQYKKEKALYKKAEKDFPENPDIIRRQSIMALSAGDTATAYQYIEKFISIGKGNSLTEAGMNTDLAMIYSEAGILNRAEAYYRRALSLEPDAITRTNNLANFLIDEDQNISGGLELIDKALKINPNNWRSLLIKGMGLNKLGKYQEALEFLEKSDSLKPRYSHNLFLNLEKAKSAVKGYHKKGF